MQEKSKDNDYRIDLRHQLPIQVNYEIGKFVPIFQIKMSALLYSFTFISGNLLKQWLENFLHPTNSNFKTELFVYLANILFQDLRQNYFITVRNNQSFKITQMIMNFVKEKKKAISSTKFMGYRFFKYIEQNESYLV